jgi:hypothetical protein
LTPRSFLSSGSPAPSKRAFKAKPLSYSRRARPDNASANLSLDGVPAPNPGDLDGDAIAVVPARLVLP